MSSPFHSVPSEVAARCPAIVHERSPCSGHSEPQRTEDLWPDPMHAHAVGAEVLLARSILQTDVDCGQLAFLQWCEVAGVELPRQTLRELHRKHQDDRATAGTVTEGWD